MTLLVTNMNSLLIGQFEFETTICRRFEKIITKERRDLDIVLQNEGCSPTKLLPIRTLSNLFLFFNGKHLWATGVSTTVSTIRSSRLKTNVSIGKKLFYVGMNLLST